MISVFRRMLERRALRVIVYIASFLVVFPTAFIFMLNRFFDASSWVVKVNGQSVPLSVYQQRIGQIREQVTRLREMFGPGIEQLLEAQGMKNPEQMAIDSLILQKIVEQAAQSVPVVLSPTYVKQRITTSLPRELLSPDGQIDGALFEQAYRVPYAQFEQQQADELLHALVAELAIPAAYTPQFLVRDQFTRRYAKRQFSVITIPIAVQSVNTVTPEQVKTFYVQQNRATKRYLVPEKRAGLIWIFGPTSYGINVTDEQIKHYYDINKHRGAEFESQPLTLQTRVIHVPVAGPDRQKERAKLIALRQELVGHADQFEKRGGKLLPAFSQGKSPYGAAFEEAAMRLPKDGDITQVIEVKDGLAIAQRVSKKPRAFKPIEQVKNIIAQRLRDERFKRTFLMEARRVIHEAQSGVQEAVQQFGVRKHGAQKSIGLVAQGGVDKQAQRLFDVRKDGYAAFLDGDVGMIVHTTQLEKSFFPSFDELKGHVEVDLKAEKAHQAAHEQASKLQMARKFDDALAQTKFTRESTGWISANDKNAAEILKKFKIPKNLFWSLNSTGQTLLHDAHEVVYVLRLDQIAPFDQAEFNKREGEITAELSNQQQALVQQGFIDCLLRHATIKKNTDKNMKLAEVADYDTD